MGALFQTVERIVTGAGCLAQLPQYAAGLGKKCLLVSGKRAMREQGYVARTEALLNSAGISTCILLGVENEPDLVTVESGVRLFREKECDLVLGLGGGSALDAAKAIAKFAATGQSPREVFDGVPFAPGGFPVIAIPSTFGTGTEATRVSVLSDRARRLKRGIRDDAMLPRLALVDPDLGKHAPPAVIAASGMDALVQAIESFFSRHATDLTEALAFNAFVLLGDGLPRWFRDPACADARSNCANGSLMAGMAFSNSRLGIIHGLAHPVGARLQLAHGALCALALPHALRFNRPAAEKKYGLLSGMLGMDAADWAQQALREFGLLARLPEGWIAAADLEAVVEEVLASGSTEANCRPVSADDVRFLLREMR